MRFSASACVALSVSRGVERHCSIISFASINEDTDLLTKIQIFRSSHHPCLSHVRNGLRALTGSPWTTEPEDAVEKEPHSLLRMHMKQA